MAITIIISGPWGTFASLFFFLAALLGGDLLALRGCLFLAYVFLLINGATGLPAWVSAVADGRVGVDMMVWAVAAGVLHCCAVVRMLMDELPVRWSNIDDEQLARFFNRRSGMEPLEAKEVLKRGRWLRVPAGQTVVSSVELYEHVYLLVEGCCSFMNPCCHSAPASPQQLSPAESAATPEPLQRLGSATLAGLQQQQVQEAQTQYDCSQQTAAQQLPAEPQQSHGVTSAPAVQPMQQQHPPQQLKFGHFTLTRSMSLSDDNAVMKAADVEISFSSAFIDTAPAVLSRPAPAAAGSDGHSAAAGSISLTPAVTGTVADGSIKFGVSAQQLFGAAVRQTLVAATSASVLPAQPQNPALPQKHAQDAVASKLGKNERLLRSGNIFSLSALNVFGVYIGFDQYHGSWPMPALEEMAINCSPSLAAYWRNFITYSLASEFELNAHKRMLVCRCSTGEYEPDSWIGGGRSRDFTDPPRPFERPAAWSWQRCKRWLLRAVSPFPPHGIRHTALPVTGVMARTRAMAVAEARTQAARSRDVSLRLGLPGGVGVH